MVSTLNLDSMVLNEEEMGILSYVMSEVPEMVTIVEKLSSGTNGEMAQEDNVVEGEGGPKEDNVPIMASAGEYVIPVEVVEALGVDYFDSLVDETKTAIGSAATQTSDVPAQQGQNKE